MRLVLALLALFPLSATAATYNVQMTGQWHTVRLTHVGPFDILDFQFADVQPYSPSLDLFGNGSGSAKFTELDEGGVWSKCQGMLTLLCSFNSRPDLNELLLAVLGGSGFFRVAPTEIVYAYDHVFTVFDESGTFFTGDGHFVLGDVESLSVTQVPLPPTALLLLSALAALRYKHRASLLRRTGKTFEVNRSVDA